MPRPAESDFPIHPLIRERWSPVIFAPRSVTRDALHRLLEAARWAPSSYNEQPWSFLVALREHAEDFATLLSCLVEANQHWAQHAGVLMVACAQRNFRRNGRPNRHAFHDVGMATQNLLLQAQAEGLAGHVMAGFDPDRARQLLQIPDTHEAVTMIAVGYPATDPRQADPVLLQREAAPRERKPQREWVFGASWNRPWE